MRGRYLCIASACVAAMLISVAVEAQSRGKSRTARMKPVGPRVKAGAVANPTFPIGPRLAILDPGGPAFCVEVDPELTLTPAEEILYQDMATALSNHTAVPPDRENFYSGVEGYTLKRWDGIIRNVAPIAGGYRVTATVVPDMVTPEETPALVLVNYSEQFDVINGVATYVGFQDPDGVAGQELMISEE